MNILYILQSFVQEIPRAPSNFQPSLIVWRTWWVWKEFIGVVCGWASLTFWWGMFKLNLHFTFFILLFKGLIQKPWAILYFFFSIGGKNENQSDSSSVSFPFIILQISIKRVRVFVVWSFSPSFNSTSSPQHSSLDVKSVLFRIWFPFNSTFHVGTFKPQVAFLLIFKYTK